ncbi:unnamed protein product [Clonostachys solani]|uniref:Uncharacterized protein n=1 Tax=Clonostachys solani TaxID=160281 RepID=A0A9N9YTS9_9HYPO|nr:unnamed protein product [Clonostachys solani]
MIPGPVTQLPLGPCVYLDVASVSHIPNDQGNAAAPLARHGRQSLLCGLDWSLTGPQQNHEGPFPGETDFNVGKNVPTQTRIAFLSMDSGSSFEDLAFFLGQPLALFLAQINQTHAAHKRYPLNTIFQCYPIIITSTFPWSQTE